MSIIIRLERLADGRSHPHEGCYVKAFDPDALGGRGHEVVTPFPDQALRFSSEAEALRLWRRRSRVRPTRPDGRPNRPMTAWTVSLLRVP